MRIVLTGGVTGGHIYPAIAIGDKFRTEDPNNAVVYIASGHPLERQIIPDAGYELYEVDSEPLSRKNFLHLFKTFGNTVKGRMEAISIMRKFKPDVVISTGSYVSVPVVLAAHALGASVYLHEQNGYPGVSNRTMARFAKAVFLGFDAAAKYFPDSATLVSSGNPVRKEFYGRDRAADRKALGIPEDDMVIMVFGGSQGAETTNAVGERLAEKYAGKEGYTLIWGTGSAYYDQMGTDIDAKGIAADNIRVMPYISDMPAMLSACDVSICRSGALSVAETTMAGRCAIFIPSPNVTEDHQYHNARAVADKGGAFIVTEDEGAYKAAGEICKILDKLDANRSLIREMEEASLSLAPSRASDIIYEKIMETYKSR